MKHFLGTLLLWIVILAVFAFFFAAFLFDRQHIYRAVLPAAVVFAAITHGFERQSARISALERRVELLEQEQSPKE